VISFIAPFSDSSRGFALALAAVSVAEGFGGVFAFESTPLFDVAAPLEDFAAAGAAAPLCAGALALLEDFGFSAAEEPAPSICSLFVCSLVAATALDAAFLACVNVDIDCASSRGAKPAARQMAAIPAAIDFVIMINSLP
jgi:hypothetical protein